MTTLLFWVVGMMVIMAMLVMAVMNMMTLMMFMMMVVFVVVMVKMVSFVDGRVRGDGDFVIVRLVIMAVVVFHTWLPNDAVRSETMQRRCCS